MSTRKRLRKLTQNPEVSVNKPPDSHGQFIPPSSQYSRNNPTPETSATEVLEDSNSDCELPPPGTTPGAAPRRHAPSVAESVVRTSVSEPTISVNKVSGFKVIQLEISS